LADISGMMDARAIKSADFLLILNRQRQHLSGRRPAQPASGRPLTFICSANTRGTSAGGAAEAGKFLRVPGN